MIVSGYLINFADEIKQIEDTTMSDTKHKLRIGITLGDPNGIGPEVVIKALNDSRILEEFTPVVYGAEQIVSFYRKEAGIPVQRDTPNPVTIESIEDIKHDRTNFIDTLDADFTVEPGVRSSDAGQAALRALERATADLKDGLIDALVTAPIDKATIQCDDFKFHGHTEYLEDALAEDGRDKALMVLTAGDLRVALVTGHIPLKDVSATLSVDLIVEKLRLFERSLREDFMIVQPRIAVLALNPHAGDSGLLGNEEADVIIPAIEAAQQAGIEAYGPYSADGFFGARLWRKFDGVLAMYHDQGLAPLKALGMDCGVNLTTGLAYVRTSPDHGTAYDIAGQGVADGDSMRQAIYMAIDVARNRKRHAAHTANPLKKQQAERPRNRAHRTDDMPWKDADNQPKNTEE